MDELNIAVSNLRTAIMEAIGELQLEVRSSIVDILASVYRPPDDDRHLQIAR